MYHRSALGSGASNDENFFHDGLLCGYLIWDRCWSARRAFHFFYVCELDSTPPDTQTDYETVSTVCTIINFRQRHLGRETILVLKAHAPYVTTG